MSVYFAQREELIKIGYSRNVPDRMVALKSKLIGAIPGDRAVEAKLHERFSHLRAHGEWFKAGEDLLAYIKHEAQNHKPDSETAQTAIRFPESFIKRLDEIAERMSEPGKRFKRVEVLRLAVFRGAEQLEAERKKQRP